MSLVPDQRYRGIRVSTHDGVVPVAQHLVSKDGQLELAKDLEDLKRNHPEDLSSWKVCSVELRRFARRLCTYNRWWIDELGWWAVCEHDILWASRWSSTQDAAIVLEAIQKDTGWKTPIERGILPSTKLLCELAVEAKAQLRHDLLLCRQWPVAIVQKLIGLANNSMLVQKLPMEVRVADWLAYELLRVEDELVFRPREESDHFPTIKVPWGVVDAFAT